VLESILESKATNSSFK